MGQADSMSYGYGFLHRPSGLSQGSVVLTHGAGADCNAPLLIAVAEKLASDGWLVYRFDLPFRRKRPSGPPHPSLSAEDQEGIRDAVGLVREDFAGRVILAGHSYGGRQATMAAANDQELADGLLLMSYPLHPPGKPLQWRTAHFPKIRIRTAFVHGERDAFGSPGEMREALALIPAPTSLHIIPGAGHDLRKAAGGMGTIVQQLMS